MLKGNCLCTIEALGPPQPSALPGWQPLPAATAKGQPNFATQPTPRLGSLCSSGFFGAALVSLFGGRCNFVTTFGPLMNRIRVAVGPLWSHFGVVSEVLRKAAGGHHGPRTSAFTRSAPFRVGPARPGAMLVPPQKVVSGARHVVGLVWTLLEP